MVIFCAEHAATQPPLGSADGMRDCARLTVFYECSDLRYASNNCSVRTYPGTRRAPLSVPL